MLSNLFSHFFANFVTSKHCTYIITYRLHLIHVYYIVLKSSCKDPFYDTGIPSDISTYLLKMQNVSLLDPKTQNHYLYNVPI